MSFPRYKNYKNSGVEWLGEVPIHWNVSALKRKIRMRYGDTLPNEVRIEGEVEVFGSNGPVGSHCVANTKAPAIVIGRKGSCGKIVWAENGGFVIDTTYVIDADTTSLTLRWVYFALQPLRLDALSQDTGVPGLARENAYEIRIAIPPPDEQLVIATFLDRETAKIDTLIAEQRRLIELLKEKRQAVISHVVTKGVNPDAPMKDSGIEWLGEIPAHWKVVSAKRVADVFVPQRNKPELNQEETGVSWATMEDMKGEEILQTSLWVSKEAAKDAGSRILNKGAVIASCVGNFGLASINSIDLIINQQLQAYIPRSAIKAKFLRYCLCASKSYFEQAGTAATIIYVNQEGFENFPLALPPLIEQEDIISQLSYETAKIDSLTTEIRCSIALLQERRTALISAAVTGKIDVRQAVELEVSAAMV